MCKYCKSLKRIKDLDENEYKKIIHHWRLRDLEARKLLGWCVVQLDKPICISSVECPDLSKVSVDWSYGEMLDRIERFIGK